MSRISTLLSLDDLEEVAFKLCEFYPEINYLVDAKITPETYHSEYQGKILGKHVELDKTIVGILCLLWSWNGNYESFVECQQDQVKLKPEQFEDMRNRTIELLKDEEGLEFMITFIVFNDLGKVPKIAQYVKKHLGEMNVDHDMILHSAFKLAMERKELKALFPSTKYLSRTSKKNMLKGLSCNFNFAQFLQGENVAASLKEFRKLDATNGKYFILHSIYDMAGAAGHFKQNGSIVVTNQFWDDCVGAIKALEMENVPVKKVYRRYINYRGKRLQLNEFHLIRLCCMARKHTPQEAENMRKAWDNMPIDVQAKLSKELCLPGVKEEPAIILYYAPALFQNLIKSKNMEEEEALTIGLNTLEKLYAIARDKVPKKMNQGFFKVDISEAAKLATKDPQRLISQSMQLNCVGEEAIIELHQQKIT